MQIRDVSFVVDAPPNLTCPTCEAGGLRLDSGSVQRRRTALAKGAMGVNAEWNSNWPLDVFVCFFNCTNSKCGESVAATGVVLSGQTETVDVDGQPREEYVEVLSPRYFEPPLRLFAMPLECSEAIRSLLMGSFRLAFASPAGAVNHVRQAVEALLTDLGVIRFATTKKGRRRALQLHERIAKLPPGYHAVLDEILATKWLGNAGSHVGVEATKEDVDAAYTLMEHVLVEIYSKPKKRIRKLAKAINRRKGPPSPDYSREKRRG